MRGVSLFAFFFHSGEKQSFIVKYDFYLGKKDRPFLKS